MSNRDLSWLMDQLRDETAGVLHVLLLAEDGLRSAKDQTLGVDSADKMAAICSGMANLGAGAGDELDGGALRSVVVDLERKQLVIMAAGRGSVLGVLAEADADLALVATAMVQMIERLADHLGVAPRAAQSPAS
ncbi:roadblock/LC7 domain-containing protein [Streptomyces sp. NPDC057654]|uniref:roadblock/LC7 domain-containing protein n=1 Tax=Streptomyces sp. NPDC057654 TaxID=3346196 RepID=UPI0036C48098